MKRQAIINFICGNSSVFGEQECGISTSQKKKKEKNRGLQCPLENYFVPH